MTPVLVETEPHRSPYPLGRQARPSTGARRNALQGTQRRVGESTVRESRPHQLLLPRGVALIFEVLQRAAATSAEMRAGRGYAPRPWRQDFHDPGRISVAAGSLEFRAQPIAG
ncbi:MAG TPA: hypothetical protein VE914_22405 [Candidatus Angelobacter sp.]|nr:hypothetical protein [Candidatus Angelobacter sp.]